MRLASKVDFLGGEKKTYSPPILLSMGKLTSLTQSRTQGPKTDGGKDVRYNSKTS